MGRDQKTGPEDPAQIEVSWVCRPCGKAYGAPAQKHIKLQKGRCAICGEIAFVTAGRTYGIYMTDPLGDFDA